jgi:hypothetical protein
MQVSANRFNPCNASLLIIAVILASASRSSADCKITETADKFEVVCSGNYPVSTAAGTKTHASKSGTINKTNKPHFKGTETRTVQMSEEEKRIMQSNNHRDGLRSNKKPTGKNRSHLSAGKV